MAEVGKSDVEEVTQKMDQVKVDDHPQEASNGIAEGMPYCTLCCFHLAFFSFTSLSLLSSVQLRVCLRN